MILFIGLSVGCIIGYLIGYGFGKEVSLKLIIQEAEKILAREGRK